jgi:hypothetical protein
MFANVVAQSGATTGAYVRMLDENANYLGRLGQRVIDVGQLWAFELQQANGFNVLGPLASAVPSAFAAYAEAVERFGRLPLSAALAAGTRCADEGFPIDAVYARKLKAVITSES